MAIRNLVEESNSILSKKAKKITQYNEDLWELLDDMKDTMHKEYGVGLAAPQVGVLKACAIVEVNNMFIELLNPKIIEEIGNQCGSEGCLSIKGATGYVNRPEQITVEAEDRYGNQFRLTATGFLAVAICHEVDHLNGVLFTSKIIKE